MSFSSDVKIKLCSAAFSCPSCRNYETAGALDFGGTMREDAIRFSTENGAVIERIKDDIKGAFGIDTHISGDKTKRIEINDINSIDNIRDGILPMGDMPFSCCAAAYARGAFLGGGSVTDPQKGYHLEFDTKSALAAERLRKFLKSEGFETKITQRKGYNIVYVKGSEEIADILGYMGAATGALELFNVQAEREMRNGINRLVNCENANTNKAAKASSKHLIAIKRIKQAKKWDKLPGVLKEIGNLRQEFPEDSLKELGEKTDPPIGKSGVNHRLNRIMDIAENL